MKEMLSFFKVHLVYLLITLLILLLSIPAVINISKKADLPFSVYSSGTSVLIKEIREPATQLLRNDRVISIDGLTLSGREDIEIIMDSKDVGMAVDLKLQRGNEVFDTIVKSVNFYSVSFVALQIITVIIFLLLGWFVIIKSPGSKPAGIFFFSMIGAATIMLMTWGKYNNSFDLSYIPRFVFHTAYIFTPILFIHFSLSFPKDDTDKHKKFLVFIYSVGLILLVPVIISFYKTATDLNSTSITTYISVYNLNRYLLAASVIISTIIFIRAYLRTKDPVEKKKLKWLLMGFIIGPMSFVFLWVLPQAFTDYAFIPEELVYFLMLSIPVTFTISIVKYHLLDIDFLINRSVVYSLLITIIIFIYLVLVLLISSFIAEINKTILSSLSAVFVAFLFNPLKNYVRHFVDRKFFRIQYDFRKAVSNLFSEMKEINDVPSLSEKLISGIYNLIPVEKIALIDISNPQSEDLLARHNFSSQDYNFIKESILTKYSLQHNIALSEKTENGISFEKEQSLKSIKLSLILTSGKAFSQAQIILAMGYKKSGYKYSNEDVDLLLNILNSAASFIARIRIQEDLLRKNMEAEKLIELNKQKSMFVSTVSHDLKTPLASIRVYSELIKMNNDTRKIGDYVKYIEGESERLKRLIDNVLTFSTIEKGIKEYRKEPADLNEILKKTLEIMDYQVKLSGFEIKTNIQPVEMLIYADTGAVTELFINLINNSMKYSGHSRIILISTAPDNETYNFTIQDFGIGISEEDQKNLYTPFYRSPLVQAMKIEGTGLGLSIIKHITDAHNIKIIITSKLSEGTTFTLKFPKCRGENIYEEHLVN